VAPQHERNRSHQKKILKRTLGHHSWETS
jgi:hypothetical protein